LFKVRILLLVFLVLLPIRSIAADDFLTISYADYAIVLSRYVDAKGLVNYAGLKSDRPSLDAFLDTIAKLDPARFESWSDKDRMAFYINAYNALTIAAVLDRYPIKKTTTAFPKGSIRQIPGVWDKVKFTMLGKAVTLNEIEHAILRERFSEPMIHFALAYGTVDGAKLRDEPYTGSKLDAQFQSQARGFLKESNNLRFEKGKVLLSALFNWFGNDFIPKYRTEDKFIPYLPLDRAILNFLLQYTDKEIHPVLLASDYKVEYIDFNWSLNDQKVR
jgi:hypothetical protein